MNSFATTIRMVHAMSDESLIKLKQIASEKRFAKGEAIFTEGEVNNRFYVVKKGLLRFFHINDNRDYTICFAGQGGIVASLHSYFCDKPAMCSIEAVTDVTLYQFQKEKLEQLFSESAEVANWGRLIAYQELYTLERRFTYVGTGDAYSRYKAFMQMRPIEEIREIPLKHIASYLHITPQTLSKMRRRYVRE